MTAAERMDSMELGERFLRYFEVLPATTPDRLEQTFRIRSDVYCHEFGYESADEHPEGLESDLFDTGAKHCLIVHRPTGLAAGCVRLILADAAADGRALPFETFCQGRFSPGPYSPDQVPSDSKCEISRLIVHTLFRRRPGERRSPLGDLSAFEVSEQERRTFPLISVALFLAAANLVVQVERAHMYAVMEPRLARLIRRSGADFEMVGEIIAFRGQRAPFHMLIDEALSGMHPSLRHLHEEIGRSLRTGIQPQPVESSGGR
jgi:N-acyl amino acid synthase of PEP-CTERM/exosortase system